MATRGEVLREVAAADGPRAPRTLGDHQHATARRLIEDALERTGGQVARAAEVLGISRVTLWRRMRRYGMRAGTGT